jgi:hypothetical protein
VSAPIVDPDRPPPPPPPPRMRLPIEDAMVDHLRKQVGPDPSVLEIAARIVALAFAGEALSQARLRVLPRLAVDLAAALVQEIRGTDVTDDTGKQIGVVSVSNDGLFWGEVLPSDGTTFTRTTRADCEQAIRDYVQKQPVRRARR